VAEKQEGRLKHIEFVPLDPGRALVVLVAEDGGVENRVIKLPAGLTVASLAEASNYLNRTVRGMNIAEARGHIERQLAEHKAALDVLTQKVVQAGLAEWSGAQDDKKSLIVRGQANLLKDLCAIEDLERVRQLFEDLEHKRDLQQLLSLAESGEGVRIFIGSENRLFSLSGSSLVVAPFQDRARNVVGIIGVIGPTRLNYARIIPMVDYTAKVVGRLLT
jgi:heat-inducible transcriptional repressor